MAAAVPNAQPVRLTSCLRLKVAAAAVERSRLETECPQTAQGSASHASCQDDWWTVLDLVRKGIARKVGDRFELVKDRCPKPDGAFYPF